MAQVDLNSLGVELEIGDDSHVVEALLLAKVSRFGHGDTALAVGKTPGLDWIAQFGLLEAALHVLRSDPAEED